MPTYPVGTRNWAKQKYDAIIGKYVKMSTGPSEEFNFNKHHEMTCKLEKYEEILEDPNAVEGDPIFSMKETEELFGQTNLLEALK